MGYKVYICLRDFPLLKQLCSFPGRNKGGLGLATSLFPFLKILAPGTLNSVIAQLSNIGFFNIIGRFPKETELGLLSNHCRLTTFNLWGYFPYLAGYEVISSISGYIMGDESLQPWKVWPWIWGLVWGLRDTASDSLSC